MVALAQNVETKAVDFLFLVREQSFFRLRNIHQKKGGTREGFS
jgi:hypothetical protein